MTTWRRAWSAIAAAGLLGAAAASCNLVAGLDKIKVGEGGGGGATPCESDAACDDGNPCTTDACGPDKVCVFTPLDGVPAPADDEDCTVEACAAGVVQHTPKPDGTACQVMGANATCHGGVCVPGCESDDQCVSNDPCVIATCDKLNTKCVFMPAPDGTQPPGVQQVPGDCHVRACKSGSLGDLVDDGDVPVTPTDCDTEVCTDGAASNPAKPIGNACSTFMGDKPGFCDGAGHCAQCAEDGDCPGTKDDCQHPACVNFACTTAFADDMTPVATQMPGDCHTIVCDGAGNTKSVVDDTDTPVDGTVCTNDICTNGVPSNTPNPGVACETATSPFVCNAAGQCGCKADGDCTAPNTCGGGNPGTAGVCGCTKTTCAAKGATCGMISDACFGMLNCDNGAKNGGETDVDCGGPTSGCATRCAVGKKCNAGSDCASGFCVDGVCCNNACSGTCNACSAAKKGQGADGTCGAIKIGTDPDNECTTQSPTSCGTTGSCDGAGACQLYGNTTACSPTSCADATTVNKAKMCNGMGACVTPVPSTQSCGAYACLGVACATFCATDNDCSSGNYCSAGACVAKKVTGSTCSGPTQCATGFCVDGFCCNTACNTACQACSAALKQSGIGNGSCGNSKNGASDPRGACATTTQASCGTDGLCKSGACEMWPTTTQCAPDSCSNATLTAAKTCDGAGACALGGGTSACPGNLVCQTMATCATACGSADSSGDANCVSGFYCDGLGGGACQPKRPSFDACTRNAECVSGFCSGSVCF